ARAAASRERRARREPPAKKPRRRSDLVSRVLVAIPLAIATIIFINLGGLAFQLFIIAAGLICVHECYRLLEAWRPVSVVVFAALVGMVFAARSGGQGGVLEVAMAALPVTLLLVLAREQPRPTVAIGGTLLGVYWVGLAFAHVELLRELPHGDSVLLDVLIGTFVADTAAYAGGRLFGRRQLAPAISPGKTVEGLVCGMLGAIIAIFIAGLYQTWLTQGNALLLGVAVALLGPLGDLFESLVKRDAGVKDAGTLFGAHGGALDRLDAALFTVVVGFYVWQAVVH
ncbi:MAG TPA: phosphatidate cytidylyltransferase, partial [Solirubrobacteraceae bacterium]|nr:phosphatidate cytidylyltransferase [Solirubrobacteraceae bacterium]